MADDREGKIRDHAYRLWQQEGEPHGRDREHWDRAEREFAGEPPLDAEDAAASDPQIDADAGAAATAVGSDDAEVPSGSQAESAPAASPAPAPKPAAKKAAPRRKRTT